jgi:D-alanyl-D-alanine carboxypeptidase/D-alanyl-D-alanine-endopeptidase (penicillin-binding protein 4)
MTRRALWLGWLLVWSALAAQPRTLADSLNKLLTADWLRFGYCGIVVRDLQTGETLYQRDAERVLIPASNNKLLVTAGALALLGADYRLRTEVWRHGTVDADGVLKGDLILVGKGDASLSYGDLQKLAQQVREAGIRRVEGRLLYDDTWLDAERYGFGWNIDDEPPKKGVNPRKCGWTPPRTMCRLSISRVPCLKVRRTPL